MKVPTSTKPHPSCDLCKYAHFTNGYFVWCEKRINECGFIPKDSDRRLDYEGKLAEIFRGKTDVMMALLDNAREEFAKAWLMAMGWDGKDIWQARDIAEGYILQDEVKNGIATFKIVKAEKQSDCR